MARIKSKCVKENTKRTRKTVENIEKEQIKNLKTNDSGLLSEEINSTNELTVGQKVVAKMTTGEFHSGEIILSRIKNDNVKQYLVHFDGMNRRLDIWLTKKDIFSNFSSMEEIMAASNGMITEMTKNALFGNKSQTSDEPEKKMTRQRKRKLDEIYHIPQKIEDMDATTAALEKAHEEFTKIKYIEEIEIGYYIIKAWYFSPYPGKYGKSSKLYICEFCLKYMINESSYTRHMTNCNHMLIDKIYQKDNILVFQVDGAINKLYCQNLCLLSKLFLDHKTLYYDVDHFYYYILVEADEYGSHIAGYFSKEKNSDEGYNLSCIMVLPPHQRKGYGKFLISLSYEISKIEGKIGTPEKPLSDLGRLSYRSYWCWVLLEYLNKTKCAPVTLATLSSITGFQKNDIIYSLQTLGLLRYWKGQYVVCASVRVIKEFLKTGNCKPPKIIADPNFLRWKPLPSSLPVKRLSSANRYKQHTLQY